MAGWLALTGPCIKFAQSEGHEKATKQPMKKARTLFSREMRATKKLRKINEDKRHR